MPSAAQPRPVWSHTRSVMLRTCPRRYYFTYIAAPRGRTARASQQERDASVLSRLTSIPLALGTAVHARAREVARAVLAGAALPSAAELLERSRSELNQLWRASRQHEAFLRDAPGSAMLAEVFYARDPGPETFTRARERLDRCTEALLDDPVWEELRGLPSASVHVLDRPLRWDHDGGSYWAAPDLVFTGRTGRVVVLDWKTGRIGTDVERQLAVYAWFVAGRLRLPGADEGCEGRVAALDGGGDSCSIVTPDEAATAGSRARAELDHFRALPAGGVGCFPLTSRRALCPHCPFWGLCESELRQVRRRPASGEACS